MYALSLILNWSTVGATDISAGKLFHRLRPHTLNALATKVCLVTLGTTSLVEELPECKPGLIGIHFFSKSCRFLEQCLWYTYKLLLALYVLLSCILEANADFSYILWGLHICLLTEQLWLPYFEHIVVALLLHPVHQ